jgi:hypothetical protein
MRHSTELPPFKRERPLSAAGPIRFSLGETPAGERDVLYREFFGRSVMRYDVEPSPDAHRMLTDPHRADEKISTVAFDSGFSDVSYFNRMFRRRYGAAPSDVRAEAQGRMPRGSREGKR